MSELDLQLQTLKHKEIVKKAITEVSKETTIADYFVLDQCLMLVLDKLVEIKQKEDKSVCCNENTIKYSSVGVNNDVDTHYTCTNCGIIKTNIR